ncbi:hypothetical protein ACFV84_01855 [Kitasatospora sp. NPDC059811]|uniref:hypothetical protein n=1 Tax=Kitasatospora sp. NPDC059811 TaxID=3346957 RepID=UPI003663FE3B
MTFPERESWVLGGIILVGGHPDIEKLSKFGGDLRRAVNEVGRTVPYPIGRTGFPQVHDALNDVANEPKPPVASGVEYDRAHRGTEKGNNLA